MDEWASEQDEAGTAARFEALFASHYPDVLAFALRRLDDAAAADDVVAETFAVAWRRRGALPDHPRPWLYGVARKVIANQRRSSRRRRSLLERLQGDGAVVAGSDPADGYREREAVSEAFARLSDDEREVLILIAWERLEGREAAQVLGVSYAAFRVRLHRARRRFESLLSEPAASPVPPPLAALRPCGPTTTTNPEPPPVTGAKKETRCATD